MPLNEIGIVQQGPAGLAVGGGNNYQGVWLDPSRAQVVMDFYLKSMLDGKGFQVRAGTITTPLVGDVVITDTAAEYCVDPGIGLTILPVYNNITIRLATGTLHEYAVKSVAGASSAGTAFVLLPLITGAAANMPASGSTARVQAAGAVTVTAELATTTRRHWEWSNPAAGFTGALPGDQHQTWEPRTPPPIRSQTSNPWCIYVQIAATGTGPSYYAHMDILEFTSASLGLA
jgi:hypothetical protein